MKLRFNWTKSLEVLSSVAVLLAAAVYVKSALVTNQPHASGPRTVDAEIGVGHYRHSLGNGHVAIVEFVDFECPYCRSFHAQNWKRLKTQYIDTNQVRFFSLHFPLEVIHPNALEAGAAAECAADQSSFWDMREALFDSPRLDRYGILQVAEQMGLDQDVFEACMNTSTVVETVKRDLNLGVDLGIQGTPSFLIGVVARDGNIRVRQVITGPASLDQIIEVVEDMDQQL